MSFRWLTRMFSPKGERIPPTDQKNARITSDGEGNQTLQAAALIEEYKFVSSLIPMYRRMEARALQLSILVVAAALTFMASLLSDAEVLSALSVGAVVPFPLLIVLLTVAGMEVRIIRASRFIRDVLAPRIQTLAGDHELLTFESSPGEVLKGEWWRFFQSSWTYATFITIPGVWLGMSTIWSLKFQSEAAAGEKGMIFWTALSGTLLLLVTGVIVSWISIKHEGRAAGRPQHRNAP